MKVEKVELHYGIINGNGEYEEQQLTVPVTPVRIRQYGSVAKLIGNVMEKAKSNDEIMEFLKTQMGIVSEEFQDKETGEIIGALKDRNTGNWIEAIIFLTKEVPDDLFNLISEVSGIHTDVIGELEAEELVKLLNAVLEVNDLDAVSKAVKKFFDNLKQKFQKEKTEADAKQKHLQTMK